MSLSSLSDQEINIRVAKVEWPDADVSSAACPAVYLRVRGSNLDGEYDCGVEMDWINDDALAFRLMVEILKTGMVVIYSDDIHLEDGKGFVTYLGYDEGDFSRRVAECYLLMNGVES